MIDSINFEINNWPKSEMLLSPKQAMFLNDSGASEFVLIIKPECLTSQEKANHSISLLKGLLERYNVQVIGVSKFDSDHAKRNELFEKQYSTLNILAKFGLTNVPYNTSLLNKEIKVIGAFEFLLSHNWSAKQLEQYSHMKDNIKLGNGAYVTLIDDNVESAAYVLNPFHPFQLENFYTEGNRFIVFACRSTTNYRLLHDEMIGVYNPAQAHTDSFRRKIFSSSLFDRGEIGILNNAIHMSPSALEGAVSIYRHFNYETKLLKSFKEKIGAQALTSEGKLSNIPVSYKGDIHLLFDLCECKDVDEIYDLLIEIEPLKRDKL